MMKEFILYDLEYADGGRFSPDCFRAKAALAFLNIKFSTIPVALSDKKKIAFSKQDKVPILVIKEDGLPDVVVNDSLAIAKYLHVNNTTGSKKSLR